MKRTESQKEMILSALVAGETLTPIDALKRFGCFKLATRVSELKRDGVPVKIEMVSCEGKRFARYSL